LYVKQMNEYNKKQVVWVTQSKPKVLEKGTKKKKHGISFGAHSAI